MSQIKKLEAMLKKLETARDKLRDSKQGGFIGIGHAVREAQEGGRRRRGGAYMGSNADYYETNVKGNPIAGGILSGGRREKFSYDNEMDGGNFAGIGGRLSKASKASYASNPYYGNKMGMIGHGVTGGVTTGGRGTGGRGTGGRGTGGGRTGGVTTGGRTSGGKKSDGRAKAAKANPWIKHVQAYAKKHKIPYQLAISEAKSSYKKL